MGAGVELVNEKALLTWFHEKKVSQTVLDTIRERYGTITSYIASGERMGIKEDALLQKPPSADEAETLLADLAARGIRILIRGEEGYPAPLAAIPDSPLLLYAKGQYDIQDELAIGVVGSRKCTAYGAWACEMLVRELAQYQITIVSGLALGIDRVAHDAALKYHTRTIGVIGNGIDKIYPASHKGLYAEVEEKGLILSEFPTWAQSLPYHFPFRNRIIAGLSLGLLVVEAKEKSGTMSTAGHALAQGKDVFCVPGNLNSIYSAGCNLLIQDGATLVRSADDILEQIAILSLQRKTAKKQEEHALSEEEKQILTAIRTGPQTPDDLVRMTGIPVQEIHTFITLLEMRGLLRTASGLCHLTQ
jgi:DNA processing protein